MARMGSQRGNLKSHPPACCASVSPHSRPHLSQGGLYSQRLEGLCRACRLHGWIKGALSQDPSRTVPARYWWHTPEGRGSRISVSSRPAWSTQQVPGQPPKQYRETLKDT